MTIVSKKLRDSAGNRQKTFHSSRPDTLPDGRSAQQCHCGQWYSLPSCHASRHKSCSAQCSAAKRASNRKSRERQCVICGASFVPRPYQVRVGGGICCSLRCAATVARQSEAFAASRPAAVAKRKANYRPRLGPENPRWKGGREATMRRRLESGKARETARKYRAKHPEKVREWKQHRRGIGRLPRGTINRLRELQRNQCAYCRTSLEPGYHADHIKPLAIGGAHEPANIQLLCPSCNVRKWRFDPVEFAQRNGRLL